MKEDDVLVPVHYFFVVQYRAFVEYVFRYAISCHYLAPYLRENLCGAGGRGVRVFWFTW